MLVQETEPEIRESLEAHLRKELGRAAARDIDQTRRLQARWRRELPYVPFGLFTLLGPHPPVTASELLDPLETSNRILGLDEPLDPDAPPAAAP